MKLKNDELLGISGGAFSAALLNAIIHGFEGLFKMGQALGSALSRILSHSRC